MTLDLQITFTYNGVIISVLRNDGATEEKIISATIDFDDNLGMEETISPLKDTPLKNPSKRTVGNTSLEKKKNKQLSFVYTKTQIIKNNQQKTNNI